MSAVDLPWKRVRAFNPGWSYIVRDEDGALVWFVSKTPDGTAWQLGGAPSTGYRTASLHATAGQARKVATAWAIILKFEQE